MRHIWVGFALALSAQLAIHASQSQPSAQQPANAAASSGTVTVMGCIQPGTAVATGSPVGPDAPTASPGPAHFVLMQPATASASDSQPAPVAPTGSGGVTPGRSGAAAGAVGTSGSIVRVSHYILHGRDGELAKHVGQRVEIVGTSSQAAPTDGPGAAATAPNAGTQVIPHEPQHGPVSTVAPGSGANTPAGPEATAHPSVQHLSVQSVRRLGGTCPQ